MPHSQTLPLDERPCEIGGVREGSRTDLRARLLPITAESDFVALSAGLHATPFQSPLWLATWLRTLGQGGERSAFWLSVEAEDGPVLALPLVVSRQNGLSIISPPDDGVSDYAAPLLGAAECVARYSASDLWRAILPALPPADLFRLRQTPVLMDGRINPLAQHMLALPSRNSGWSMDISAGYDAWFGTLSSSMREKLGKAGRRFARAEGSRTGPVIGVEDGLQCLSQLSAWQATRLQETGRDYQLDDPALDAFYRHLIVDGLADGSVMMMELAAEGASVAINFAYRAGDSLVYLRVGNEYGRWNPVAPGTLATRALIERATELGVLRYDFGAGDYEYKWRMGASRQALMDVDIPLGLSGWRVVLVGQMRRRLSQISWLKRIVQRLRRRDGVAAGRQAD